MHYLLLSNTYGSVLTSQEKIQERYGGRRLHSHRMYNWAYVFLFLCPEIEPDEMNNAQEYDIR